MQSSQETDMAYSTTTGTCTELIKSDKTQKIRDCSYAKSIQLKICTKKPDAVGDRDQNLSR